MTPLRFNCGTQFGPSIQTKQDLILTISDVEYDDIQILTNRHTARIIYVSTPLP